MRTLSGLTLLAAVLGCGGMTADFCEQECRCYNCSDSQHEECVVNTEANADVAAVYDCAEEYDAAMECILARGTCDNEHFRAKDACKIEEDRLEDCISRGSALDG